MKYWKLFVRERRNDRGQILTSHVSRFTSYFSRFTLGVVLAIVLLCSCRKSLTVEQENSTVEQGYYESAQRI